MLGARNCRLMTGRAIHNVGVWWMPGTTRLQRGVTSVQFTALLTVSLSNYARCLCGPMSGCYRIALRIAGTHLGGVIIGHFGRGASHLLHAGIGFPIAP